MESIFYYRTSIIEFVSFKRAIVAPTIRRLFHTRDRVYKILIYVYTYVLRRVSFLARGTRSKSYDRTRNTFRRIRENQRNPSKFFFRRKNTTRCFPISLDPFSKDRRNFVNRSRAFLYRWLHRTLLPTTSYTLRRTSTPANRESLVFG